MRGSSLHPSETTGLLVNGIAARSSDGFAHWEVEVPLRLGANELRVDLVDAEGAIRADVARGTGPALSFPLGLVYDPGRKLAFVQDFALEAVLAIDPATGNRSYLARKGAGVAGFAFTGDTALDAAGDRLLALMRDTGMLVAVDLSTGKGNLLSSATVGGGPALAWPVALCLDARNGRALVVDSQRHAVLSVDLLSGLRGLFASSRAGSGASFVRATHLAFDAGQARVILADELTPQILSISLPGGERRVVSGGSRGAGPALDQLRGLCLDEPAKRGLVSGTDRARSSSSTS